MTPNHRNNGPPTSAMASHAIESTGSAQRHRTMCFDFVTRMPGLTAREIEDELGIKAHKRLPELRQTNLVQNGPARTCTVSGRQALTWLPSPFTQSPTTHTGACA